MLDTPIGQAYTGLSNSEGGVGYDHKRLSAIYIYTGKLLYVVAKYQVHHLRYSPRKI